MNPPLPTWIERLLGIETAPGEGTAWHLQQTWGWPPWVTLVFAVAAVLFVVVTYARENPRAPGWLRATLAGVRLALIAIVLVMLAQFVLSLDRTGLPYVAVLVDDSLSMTVVDRYDEKVRQKILRRIGETGSHDLSRWDLARAMLSANGGALLDGIRKDYKLRLYFLTGARPGRSTETDQLLSEINATEPLGETSRLGAAIRAVLDDLRGSVPAAIILLSDGVNTDGPTLEDAAGYARRKGVPLFTIGLGDERPVRDLKLSDLVVDDVVFVDDVVHFEFKLTGGGLEGRQVRIALREKGTADVLAEIDATVSPDGQAQRLRLPYRPDTEGEFRYVVEVEPLEEELQIENNRQERLVRVRKEKIRVLFVQAYPNFEFRYLTNMLDRDGSIELKYVLQDADLEHAEQGSAALRGFPVRRDDLFQYDVIILGDVNPGLLSDAMIQNIADFVEEPASGRALICIAGPKYMPMAFRDTPLEPLLPVDLATIRLPNPQELVADGFSVEPTEMGLASPSMQLGDTLAETRSIWRNLRPLYWMIETPGVKRGARVLAVHPTRVDSRGNRLPVISMQYVGSGKVLFHATDETWRWRWRAGDVFFAKYWVQTIRYLARSKLSDGGRLATLSTDRREYRRGESVNLRVRFADERLAPAEEDGVSLVLQHQGHQTRRIKLHRSTAARGTFEGSLAKPAIGSYHAWIAVPTLPGRAPAADFTVVAPKGEFERVRMDAHEMQQAAQQTGGRFYTVDTADRLLRDLPPGRHVPVESLPPEPLWNRWPLLLLFLTLLVSEWVLRKAAGMV